MAKSNSVELAQKFVKLAQFSNLILYVCLFIVMRIFKPYSFKRFRTENMKKYLVQSMI